MFGVLARTQSVLGCKLPSDKSAAHMGSVVLRPRIPKRLLRPSRQQRPKALEVRAGLSTYRFPGQATMQTEWFSEAVRDIVKHVDRTPFLQLVQLGGVTPKFTTLPVSDAVVPVPQLWQGIAEHMSQGSHPDVVILVQHISPSQAAQEQRRATAAADEAAAWAAAAGQPTEHGDYCQPPVTPATVAAAASSDSGTGAAGGCGSGAKSAATERVEVACRKLVQSGVAESLLNGKVGDCCDGPGGHSHDQHPAAQQAQHGPSRSALVAAAAPAAQQQPGSSSVVPFLAAAAPRRRAVQAAALGLAVPQRAPAGLRTEQCPSSTCYYGVVVQASQAHTGVEGCYLLKTVKMVSATGCACTHYSLTRVAQGEHLEKQFVQSWLQ